MDNLATSIPVDRHTTARIADAIDMSRMTYERLDKVMQATEKEQKKRIFDMWLACYTQEEIAEAVGWPRQTVTDEINTFADFGHLSESGKTAANHLTDFEHPLYSVWSYGKKTGFPARCITVRSSERFTWQRKPSPTGSPGRCIRRWEEFV